MDMITARARRLAVIGSLCLLAVLWVAGPSPRAQTPATSGVATPGAVVLTPEEQAWLARSPEVLVAAQPDYAPFDFTDARGQATGYANELFVLAAEKVGLRYRFLTGRPWPEMLELARRGEVDVLTCVWYQANRADFLSYVEPPYFRHVLAIARRTGEADPPGRPRMEGRRIALVRGFSINEDLRRLHPDARFIEFDGLNEALRAVSLDQADAYIDNIGLLNHAIVTQGLVNLRVGEEFTLPGYDYYMAVGAHQPELHSILAKALQAIGPEELRALERRWLYPESDTQAVIGRYVAIGMAVLLVTFWVLALVVAWNRRLAEEVAQRTRAEAEARAAHDLAEQANAAKSAFLAAMSHEIRTPMIGVTGMLEVLSHSDLNADQRHAIAVIQQSAGSLLQIIGDILDFSKIEAGRLELSLETLDLGALVRSAAANFIGTASSKGLLLEVEVDPALWPAHRADGLRLRQILSNLVSNAVKYTDEGRITLAVRCLGEDGDVQRLVLSVADTGSGIPEQDLPTLFDPFVQVQTHANRRYAGTGLGLPICQRLAGLMDSHIDVASTPGQGTTMSFELRLARGRVEDLPPELRPALREALASPRALPDVATAERERSLVLLVDDHPTNRLVIARQLALAGYASEAAEDGLQGLEKWRSGRFALVLSDVHMPGMDGYAMARAIRAEEAARGLPRTPVVALTAAALRGEAERCLAAGMDAYLAKPVSIPRLADTLQHWLPHTRPAATPVAAEAHPHPQTELPAPLDAAVLAEMCGDDTALLAEVLQDFLAATANDLATLHAAVDAGAIEDATRTAHRIKGAARLVGAVELASTADALEASGKQGERNRIPALASDIDTAYQRLRLHVSHRHPGTT